jgi:hypothetical protein
MTLKLAASLIALTFVAGAVLAAAPAAADEPGYRTSRSYVAKRKPKVVIRTQRYRDGYAAGLAASAAQDSYARGYTDGLAARPATPSYVVYNNGTYVPPGYTYTTAPTVISPAYAYSPVVRPLDPITGALAATTVTTPVRAVQGDVASWIRDCSIRYRRFGPTDFDPVTGTFLGNDGDRYYCN